MPTNSVCVLTGQGVAAIAVVRLAGPLVDDFLIKHFSKPVPFQRCVHGLLTDGPQTIDDCVAVRHQDVLDLNVHGGIWVIESVLRIAGVAGFVQSDQRAVDAENDLWQQMLTLLPMAKTEQAVRMLLAQPKAWENPADLQAIHADRSGYWMLATPRVAIVGPPNVGKSTLANQLFGQARSITADLPGTTRDWVGELANIDGLAVMLVDTPGQHSTTDAIERAAINASLGQIQSADLVILVMDQTAALEKEFLDRYPKSLRVANKADGIQKWDAKELNAIATVAIQGDGIDLLRAAIRRHFGCEPMDLNRARWFSEHQRSTIRLAAAQRAGFSRE